MSQLGHSTSRRAPACIVFACVVGACRSEARDGDTGSAPLPEDSEAAGFTYDSSTWGGDEPYAPDTGAETVDTWLYLVQEGAWTGSPAGGPWAAMSGTFTASETDSDGVVRCEAAWTVEGEAVQRTCSSCAEGWRLRFSAVEGDASACADADLPADGEDRTYGWAPDEGLVWLDYHDTGAWIPWFDAEASADVLFVRWSAAVALEDGS